LLPRGWIYAIARDINNNRDVVGWGNDGTVGVRVGIKGFIYSGGKYTFILPEGWPNAEATGINDRGEVIGHAPSHVFPGNGFIYSNGKFRFIRI
jgi:probable HAF family extracellular repeat protein